MGVRGSARSGPLVYAGDQQGRLWKFDLSASDPLGWKVAYGPAAAPKPEAQSIFILPSLAPLAWQVPPLPSG